MKITPTALPELLILEPRVFGDARGFFTESWNEQAFNKAVGYEVRFVQDNHSRSARGVLRGLHYQLAPHTQGKLVRVVSSAGSTAFKTTHLDSLHRRLITLATRTRATGTHKRTPS